MVSHSDSIWQLCLHQPQETIESIWSKAQDNAVDYLGLSCRAVVTSYFKEEYNSFKWVGGFDTFTVTKAITFCICLSSVFNPMVGKCLLMLFLEQVNNSKLSGTLQTAKAKINMYLTGLQNFEADLNKARHSSLSLPLLPTHKKRMFWWVEIDRVEHR